MLRRSNHSKTKNQAESKAAYAKNMVLCMRFVSKNDSYPEVSQRNVTTDLGSLISVTNSPSRVIAA